MEKLRSLSPCTGLKLYLFISICMMYSKMIKLIFFREELSGLFMTDYAAGNTACPAMKYWILSWQSMLELWVRKSNVL